MNKKLILIFSSVILLAGCHTIDDIKHYYDTHIVFDENAEMSIVPGVLAEHSKKDIILEFDESVDEDILSLLCLTDYTEKMPGSLPESLPGVTFYINPEDDTQVIVNVSALDCSSPRPVTLIFDNGKEPTLAHMMLVQDASASKVYEGKKSYSAVLSDIHLNDARSKTNGWSWCNENEDYLKNYLDNLIANADQYRDLILLGDVIDEFVTPVPFAAFAKPDGTVVTEKEYFDLIAETNSDIFEKFKQLQAAGIKLIYTPGNHDCGLDEDDVHKLFGEEAMFVSDVRGLGTYEPEYASEIAMEHGHRYDVMCSPDMISNVGIDDVTEDNAFIAAQYFITRISATHDYNVKKPDDNLGDASLEDFGIDEEFVRQTAAGTASSNGDNFNKFVLRTCWNVVGIAKSVPDIETMAISTGVYGLTRDYVASQYSFLGLDPDPELYSSMYKQSEWEERLRRNNAPAGFPYLLGSIMCEVPNMDTFAVSWLAKHDKEHRIFVMGHTHNPLMMAERFDDRSKGYIYVNTGAWVDDNVSNYFTRSFVNLYFGEDGFIQVCLRQICKDGSIKNLYSPLWLKK